MPKRQSGIPSPISSCKMRPGGKRHAIFGDWTEDAFLSKVWQQEPLLIRSACPSASTRVTRADLLRLASRSAVESRLVIADKQQRHWHGQEGPFRRAELARLPGTGWTLLVQAVDHWIPELAGLLDSFSFLPRWRLDDIMVSLAAKGGGVGPHFDYYDVFLLQASGSRRWQLGQRCDESTPLRKQVDLKLLETFKRSADMTLESGDMLYVPAGLAHWGTALTDDCITISIGFRAASHRELLQIAQHHLAACLPDDKRYRDTRASIDRDNYCLNEPAAKLAGQVWRQLERKIVDDALVRALGEYATELRYPGLVTSTITLTRARLTQILARNKPVQAAHHVASRFAYRPIDKCKAELYVDGERHLATLAFAKAVCHGKPLGAFLRGLREQQLFIKLVNQGSLRLLS